MRLLSLFAAHFLLIPLIDAANFEVNFNEKEASIFWRSTRKMVNYFHYATHKLNKSAAEVLDEKEIYDLLQRMTNPAGKTSDAVNLLETNYGQSLHLTFQKLLKKDEKVEASGGGDTVHKHTATSSAKNVNDTFVRMVALFNIISAFIGASEKLLASSELAQKGKEAGQKYLKQIKDKHSANIEALRKFNHGIKGQFTETAHSNEFSAKINMTNKQNFSSWWWQMEITKVENKLISKTITVYSIWDDGSIARQDDVQPGKEVKLSYLLPVKISIPGDNGDDQEFEYKKETDQWFVTIRNKKGHITRKIKWWDADAKDTMLDYDLVFKLGESDEIQQDFYLHNYVFADKHCFSISGFPHGVFGLENKLPKRIAIAKGDTVLAVEPGEKKEFELELPLQVIIGKSGAVQERYDIEDAGDYKVHIRHTYEAKMAITNLIWHDIDSHWFGDGHKYDIVMELDPETNRAMFTIYRRSNYTSDRNFEIAFDGLLQWKNQYQKPGFTFSDLDDEDEEEEEDKHQKRNIGQHPPSPTSSDHGSPNTSPRKRKGIHINKHANDATKTHGHDVVNMNELQLSPKGSGSKSPRTKEGGGSSPSRG